MTIAQDDAARGAGVAQGGGSGSICARCGASGSPAGGACARCGTGTGVRPLGPPTAARCPVCGTGDLAGRTTCPGCGLAIPGAAAPVRSATGSRPARWQVVAAALALVGATAAVVLALGRDGPPRLHERWRVELPAAAVGAPVVSGDVVVVAVADGTLVGIDVDGAPRWRFLTEQQVTAPVAADEGLAVLATTGAEGAGLVFGVDLRTGQERWRVVTESPVTAAPVLGEHDVYLARDDVSAHHRATGEQRWRRPVEGGARGVSFGDGRVVVVGGDGLVALDDETGEVRWSSGGGRPGVPAGIVGDLVVVSDGAGGVVARALDRGQERWRAPIGGQLLQPAVAGPDVAVVVTTDGLVALDVADGSERWEAGPERDQRLRAAVAATTVSVRSSSGVLLVDALSGAVAASARRPSSRSEEPAGAPAIAEGDFLIVVEDDQVVALRALPR